MALTLAALAIAPSAASAVSVSLSVDRSSPEIGEPALFTATAGEPDLEYEFRVDGGEPETPDVGSPGRFTRAFSTPGDHTVTVRVSNEALEAASDSVQVVVVPQLRATVAQSTPFGGAPYSGEPVTFTASSTGGRGPIGYRWDFGADGTIDATGASATHAFEGGGAHATKLHAVDSASPEHTDVVNVQTSVAPGTRPLVPLCVDELEFQLATITTTGCFERSPSGRHWEIGDAGLRLNGIPIHPESGRFLTVEEPSAEHPGGRIHSSLAVILAGDAVLFRNTLDLSLPAGGPGQSGTTAPLDAYGLARLFYLNVRGKFSIRLSRAADGAPSARIPVVIQLPEPIRDAPPRLDSSQPVPRPVTNTTTLLFEGGRLRYENLRLEAQSAWYLGLPLGRICWAYAGAGEPERPCEPFTLDDRPYLECSSPVTTQRWDGTVRLELPTASRPVMGAFWSLSAGRVVSFGAARDNFAGPGLSLNLVDAWGLNRLAFGVCLGDPLRLRGDIGVAILPNRFTRPPMTIDGRWTFTAQHRLLGVFVPWTVLFDGRAKVFGTKVGTANVGLSPWGAFFNLTADVDLAGGVFTVRGGLKGWIDALRNAFSVEGSGLRACIDTVCSPSASGIVSTTGVGACFGIGKVRIFGETIKVQVGGGATWADPTDIRVVSGRCGFKRYRISPTIASVSQAGARFAVTPEDPALAVRVTGTSRPPKVRVTGPSFDVSSPAGTSGRIEAGRFALLEDKSTNSTHLILVDAEPGTYEVTGLDPGNRVTGVQTAGMERPFAARARVRRAGRGRHVLRMRYRMPADVKLTIVERGAQSTRTLARDVRRVACGPSSPLLCLTRRFEPAAGPAGRRVIEAVLQRDGIPLETHRLATYRVRAERPPSRPRVRMQRVGSTVRIGWSRSRGATRYSVVARLSDARSLSFAPGRRCRSVSIFDVGHDVRVVARVGGLRRDMRAGRYGRATLRAGSARGGKRRVRLHRACE